MTKLGLSSLCALIAGACASSPAMHPRSPIDREAAMREWSIRARDQIRDYWNPWDVIRAGGPAGSAVQPTTVLRIAVQPDGTALRPEIVTSSGVAALDELAVKAVTTAAPLPPPPADVSNGASPARFELGFRVTRGESPSSPPGDDTRNPFPVMTANCDYKVTGAADRLDVQRTVESYRRDVAACVDEQRSARLDVVGEVMVEFVITETGSVYRQTVVKTGGLPRSLEGCLLRTMSRWTFRKPTGGPVKVVFPFRFLEGQAAGADVRSGVMNGQGLPQR